MRSVEAIGTWLAIAAYAAAFALGVGGAVFRSERVLRWTRWATLAAFSGHTLALLARWIRSGHAPVQGTYENSLAGAWFILQIFWFVARSITAARRAEPLVAAVALLLVGNGLMAPAQAFALEPPFRSNWLAVHVTFAWLAFGSYVVASALAAQYLWATRPGAALAGSAAGEAGRTATPSSATRYGVTEELAGRLIAFGFVADSVMIASGAIWAHGLWGRYWAWDPVETWSLVSWLVYGVNLHLRFTLGWRGRRAAWVALASVAGIVATFFGLGVVSQVHTALL